MNQNDQTPFKFELELRDTYIFSAPQGAVSENGLVLLAHNLASVCKENNLDCILIDCEHFEGALNVTQLYYASQQFAEIVGHDKKVAYINPPPHWIKEVDQFSRNVVNTRGGNLELFDSLEKALEWFKMMKSI